MNKVLFSNDVMITAPFIPGESPSGIPRWSRRQGTVGRRVPAGILSPDYGSRLSIDRLQVNHNQRYATTMTTHAVLKQIAYEAGVPLQVYGRTPEYGRQISRNDFMDYNTVRFRK